MKDKKTNINSVEVFYNQDNEKFDKFLQSVVRDYVSEDITEPDEEDEDFSMTIAWKLSGYCKNVVVCCGCITYHSYEN